MSVEKQFLIYPKSLTEQKKIIGTSCVKKKNYLTSGKIKNKIGRGKSSWKVASTIRSLEQTAAKRMSRMTDGEGPGLTCVASLFNRVIA